MLKQRIITAVILIPLFVLLILKLPFEPFFILTAIIAIWGGWEWSLFLGMTRFPHCFLFPALVAVMLPLSLSIPILWVLYAALVSWLCALMAVMLYPRARNSWSDKILWRVMMGLLVLIPCWRALNFLRASDNGPAILLFLFVLVWGADIGAFFVGRQWGKHKLAPEVSPGKTWEGVGGALLATLIITLVVFIPYQLSYSERVCAILLSFVTVLFSILGDLFESMLKRNVGIKDSGRLFPGHGGLLDRIDSLTAAAPIFALGAIWMGRVFH